MKKSLLIVSHALELGGAEMSLLGLLDALDQKEWDVDLFLLRHEGELLSSVPKHINLLPEIPDYSVLGRPLTTVLKEGHFLLAAARFIGKTAAGRYIKKHHHRDSAVALEYSHKYTCPLMPKIQKNKTYDLAISFLTPHYFVAQKVAARKKLAWIHTDYSRIEVNKDSEGKMWNAYDNIVSISEAVTEGFLKTFPRLEKKMILIENILPKALLHKRSAEKIEDMPKADGEKILLSVGRFCSAKNFDNIPSICSRLLEQGIALKWYLIGFGGDEALIRSEISKAGMEKHVIILGKKSNPYPYIKACDLYVQPSRYEGKCVSVREAQMFGRPVVITRYATSASQLENGTDGVIVPMDNEDCAREIAKLLANPQRMQLLSDTCLTRDYSNSCEAQKLKALLEN